MTALTAAGEVLAVERAVGAVGTGEAGWLRAEMAGREGQVEVVPVARVPALHTTHTTRRIVLGSSVVPQRV